MCCAIEKQSNLRRLSSIWRALFGRSLLRRSCIFAFLLHFLNDAYDIVTKNAFVRQLSFINCYKWNDDDDNGEENRLNDTHIRCVNVCNISAFSSTRIFISNKKKQQILDFLRWKEIFDVNCWVNIMDNNLGLCFCFCGRFLLWNAAKQWTFQSYNA